MADSSQLDLVHKAVCAGSFGNIQWKESAARLVRADPDLAGHTPEGIRLLLRKFVLDGNLLTARKEVRQEKLADEPDDLFWYRAIIAVAGFKHGLFVEVKLIDDDPVEPFVEIVSAHRQRK